MPHTSISLLERLSSEPTDEAWGRLHLLYAPLLRKWLARYDVQNADADDLIQDVLTTLVRELPSFEHNGRPGAFRRWLKLTLVNRIRRFWKSRRRRPDATGRSDFAELAELEHDQSDLSRIWNQEHDESVTSQLLSAVRPRFDSHTWEAFHRQMLEGVAADTVAADLGMTIAAVYKAKSRVLRALRDAGSGLIEDI